MRLNILYLLAVLYLFAGCCETEEVVPEQTLYLKRQLSSFEWPNGQTGTTDLNFEYNRLNQMIRVTGPTYSSPEPFDQRYFYDSKNRLNHVQLNSWDSRTYSYNETDQLEKVVWTYVKPEGGHSITNYTNVYSDTRQLLETKAYNTENSSPETGAIYRYFYSGEQVTKVQVVQASTGIVGKEIIYTYDDKKPALPATPHQYTVPKYTEGVWHGRMPSGNNITSITQLNGLGEREKNYCYTATYTYNESGYPVTAVKTYEDGSIQRIAYTYTTNK